MIKMTADNAALIVNDMRNKNASMNVWYKVVIEGNCLSLDVVILG